MTNNHAGAGPNSLWKKARKNGSQASSLTRHAGIMPAFPSIPDAAAMLEACLPAQAGCLASDFQQAAKGGLAAAREPETSVRERSGLAEGTSGFVRHSSFVIRHYSCIIRP